MMNLFSYRVINEKKQIQLIYMYLFPLDERTQLLISTTSSLIRLFFNPFVLDSIALFIVQGVHKFWIHGRLGQP